MSNKGHKVHAACACNVLDGLNRRHLANFPGTTPNGSAMLAAGFEELRKLVKRPQLHKMTKQQVVDHYKGRKRTIYANAARSLLTEPLSDRDFEIKAHIKRDKTDFVEKGHKAPRVIQARTPRANITIAQHLKPLEDKLYRIRQTYKGRKYRLLAKGRNPVQRAQDILDIWDAFHDPVILGIDAANFDGHVTLEQLDQCRLFYADMMPELKKLLFKTRISRGKGPGGLKYRSAGGRMSGDTDTALGNAIITIAMIYGWAKLRGVEVVIYDDGDDCLLFMEKKELSKATKTIVEDFAEYGHELKIERTVSRLEDLEFCQQRLIRTNPPRMIADIHKLMSNAFVTITRYDGPARAGHLKTLAQALLARAPGVPVAQVYAQAVLRDFAAAKFVRDEALEREMLIKGVKVVGPATITSEARASFSELFGVPEHVQALWEQQIWATEFKVPDDYEWVDDYVVHPWVLNAYDMPALKGFTCLV